MGHEMHGRGTTDDTPAKTWAVGLMLFAVVMMVLIGIFQVISGIAAILESRFYTAVADYVFRFNVAAWGWIHLFIGILVAAAGVFVYTGNVWARATGIIVVAVSAIENFMFMPYYPLPSLLIIVLDVVVIWVLSVYGYRSPETVPRGY
ncbi:MAG: integral rane protein [Streptosporangiaceae bacterium]|jgi:hypothetical protein|nr:integral rane protein [Streptosporangiaceae bacterium]